MALQGSIPARSNSPRGKQRHGRCLCRAAATHGRLCRGAGITAGIYPTLSESGAGFQGRSDQSCLYCASLPSTSSRRRSRMLGSKDALQAHCWRRCVYFSGPFLSRLFAARPRVGGKIELTRHVQQAEALMSLGNVSTASAARRYFKGATVALQGAAAAGHPLPRHLQQ